jgi:murein DD-endopeptidase MepM/ murein hydrolase activator NlpD
MKPQKDIDISGHPCVPSKQYQLWPDSRSLEDQIVDYELQAQGATLVYGMPRTDDDYGYGGTGDGGGHSVGGQPDECNESVYGRSRTEPLYPTDKEPGDGAIDPIIINTLIYVDCNKNVNEQMRLGGGTYTSMVWSWDVAPPGLSISSSGLVSGTLTSDLQFNVVISVNAIRSSGSPTTVSDSKPFVIQTKECAAGIELIHPLPGSSLTSPYGMRTLSGARKMHKGVDFAYPGRVTKDVFAAYHGIVIYAGTATGYGNVVILGHLDGSGAQVACTLYAHMNAVYVRQGDQVKTGQPIGKEGNTGIGTGPHLHFEVRRAEYARGMGRGAIQWASATHMDPLPFINGELLVDTGSISSSNIRPDQPTGTVDTTVNTNRILSQEHAEPNCSNFTNVSNPEGSPRGDPTKGLVVGSPSKLADKRYHSSCGGTVESMKLSDVIDAINSVLDADPSLDFDDKQFIHLVASIESEYDPCAKNPTSSATGLYQFLDKLGAHYGVPTCQDRCDPVKATQAMVAFYKKEILRYYNSWINSGKTKIIGMPIHKTSHSDRYHSLSKTVWCYGLIHHDGVGTAIKGKNAGGVEYIEKRLREMT